MKKQTILFISFILLSAVLVSAQDQTTPKTISGGVLNSKAVNLVTPSFPAAARAVGAGGAVTVQVTIDEEGNVVSAVAVSGHPLLRQASEKAARESKFTPTLLQGQPVKVTGIIVYNFVVPAVPMTFMQIGYELFLAEESKSLDLNRFNSINESYPNEWEEVTANLKKLDLYLAEKNETPKTSSPVSLSGISGDKPSTTQGIRTVIGTSSVGISGSKKYSLDENSLGIIRQTQSDIENRLSSDEKRLWSFNVGKVLGKLQAGIKNNEPIQANISVLNQLKTAVPSGISATVLTKIQDVIDASEKNASETEIAERLATAIEKLRNVRGF